MSQITNQTGSRGENKTLEMLEAALEKTQEMQDLAEFLHTVNIEDLESEVNNEPISGSGFSLDEEGEDFVFLIKTDSDIEEMITIVYMG